jgi:hypothetical protein
VVRIINRDRNSSIRISTSNELDTGSVKDADRELCMGLTIADLEVEVGTKLDFFSEELTSMLVIL